MRSTSRALAARAGVPGDRPRRVRRSRGRARALRRRRRWAPRRPPRRGDGRLPQPDRRAREARLPARRPRPVARRPPTVRARRRRARESPACTTSRSSARATATRTSRSARSACSARFAWTTRRRCVPFASRPTSSRASSKRSTATSDRAAAGERHPRWHDMSPMSTTERDYYELLGVPRNADEQAIKKAFRRLARELHPDVSDVPDAEVRFREVTEAYEALSNPETRELYDRYGHAGLRSGGFQPTSFDLGSFGDLFSAFFGDDVFGGRRGGGAARGGDVVGRDRDHARRLRAGHQGRGAARARRRLRDLPRRRSGARARPIVACPRCGGGRLAPAGLARDLRRVRPPVAVPGMLRQRPPHREEVRDLRRRGTDGRGAEARGRGSRRASTTASASASPARGTREASAAARATPTSSFTSSPTTGSCARATTSSPRST